MQTLDEKSKKINDYKNNLNLLFIIFAIFIWSTSFVGTKIAFSSFSPFTLGTLRFVIALFVLGFIMILKKEFIIPKYKDLIIISFSGILGITLYFALENIGLKLTTASNAALIVASFPVITVFLEAIIYRVKISWIKIIGIILSIIGVYYLLISRENDISNGQLLGNIILILTGFIWAFYNFITRKVVNKYPAISISFYQTIAGVITFIPLALLEKHTWRVPDFKSFLVILYLGIFCSVVAYLFYNYGLKKISSSTAVTLMNLIPVFGVFFSIVFLHEKILISQILGGVIVIIGVLLSVNQNLNS